MRILLTAAWMIVIIYSTIPLWWLAIHPFAARWRKMRRSPYRALLPLWIAMWIIAVAVTWPWHEIQLYRTPFAWIATAALLAISIPIYRRTSRNFGRPNLIGQSELRPGEFEQKLVTSGLHGRMRHPVYLAHLCNISAFTIGTGLLVNYCLLAFAIITGAVMIIMEERELEARFGDAWREYRRRVPAIIPLPLQNGRPLPNDQVSKSASHQVPDGAAR